MAVSSSIGGMMEKKIRLLEKRLSLVERFVEMRFCESFRDFSIRNNSTNEEDDIAVEGRQGSTISVRIIKKVDEEKAKSKSSSSSSSTSVTPAGRRSTRISARQKKQGRENVKDLKRNGKKRNEQPIKIEIVEEVQDEDDGIIPQEVEEENGGDDYFTFPSGGGGVSQEEEQRQEQEETMEHDDPLPSSDDDLSESDEDKLPPRKKRNSSAGAGSKERAKKVRKKYQPRQRALSIPPEKLMSTKECPVCHVHCKPSAYPAHVAMHGKERHLKCGFCEKRFHNRAMLLKHERTHQPDKYGKICRVPGCGKMVFQTTRMLGHERSCIRKALENGVEVDKEVMDEIRRRSQNVDLNWPGEKEVEGKKRKCKVCGKEVEREQWTKHMRGHARWKCERCGDKVAVFTEKRSLLRHNRHFHGGKGEEEGSMDEDQSEVDERVKRKVGKEDKVGEEIMEGRAAEVIGEKELQQVLKK